MSLPRSPRPRPPRRARGLAVGALLAALAPVLPASPGAAAPASPSDEPCVAGRSSVTVDDAVGEVARGIDVHRLGLWDEPGQRCVWTTVEGRFAARRANVVQVLYDLDHSRAGAEAYAFFYSGRDGDRRTGSRVAGLVDGRWRYLRCSVGSFFRPGQGFIGLGVPRTCLGLGDRTGRVRVSVRVWEVRRYTPGDGWRGRADVVPGGRRWSPTA